MSDTSEGSDGSDGTGRSDSGSGDRPVRKAPAKRTTKTASKASSRTGAKTSRKPSKSGAPRAQARKPAEPQQDDQQHNQQQDNQQQDGRHDRPKGTRLAVLAAEQLVDLTGKEFEGIVGLSKSDDGWSVSVEVLEMRRIPSTTDVIAVYEVDVDRDGDLTGYRRRHRFLRGEAGEDR